MPFPMELEQRETQITPSSIWTQTANSGSFNDNRYTKSTSSMHVNIIMNTKGKHPFIYFKNFEQVAKDE